MSDSADVIRRIVVATSLLEQRAVVLDLGVLLQIVDELVGQRVAGAFRLLSARFGLLKADRNTHLYLSPDYPFPSSPSNSLPPGRTWQIIGVYTRAKEVQRALTRASVLTRNYVLPADALRKQLRLKDGGDDYIIGCRIADKPLLLHCRRCYAIE